MFVGVSRSSASVKMNAFFCRHKEESEHRDEAAQLRQVVSGTNLAGKLHRGAAQAVRSTSIHSIFGEFSRNAVRHPNRSVPQRSLPRVGTSCCRLDARDQAGGPSSEGSRPVSVPRRRTSDAYSEFGMATVLSRSFFIFEAFTNEPFQTKFLAGRCAKAMASFVHAMLGSMS